MLHRHHIVLMSFDTPQNSDQTGPVHLLRTNEQDGLSDASQEWGLMVDVEQSNGASSPTISVKLQGSMNGSSWVDLGTAVNTSTTERKVTWQKLSYVLSHVRAITVLGGGTKPDCKLKVLLTSNGAFIAKSGAIRIPSKG